MSAEQGFASRSVRLSGRQWLTTQGALGLRIAQLALICNERILDPGVVERLLQPDPGPVTSAQRAHRELCGLLHLYFRQQRRLLEELGPISAALLQDRLREELGQRALILLLGR